jgi:hypothetical protein
MKSSLIIVLGGLLAVMSLTQCKKEEGKYAIQGKITHARTGAPLSGAAVNLQKKVVGGSVFNAAYTTAANATTGSDGQFAMDFQRENFAGLKLVAHYSQFISREQELNVGSFSVGSTYNQSLSLYPEAFIDVHFQHTALEAPSDRIRFTFLNAQFDCICCSEGYKEFTGIVDTLTQCKLYGDQWLKYRVIFTKAEQDSTVVDSVYCPAFQTTPLHIVY